MVSTEDKAEVARAAGASDVVLADGFKDAAKELTGGRGVDVDAVGVGWGAWAATHPGYLTEQWAELEPLLASGAVSAPEPVVYPLERAAEAIASLEDRTAKGKVVVKVR